LILFPFATWIAPVQRVVADIRIQVQIVLVSHRIGLQEAAEVWIVDAGFVVVELELRQHRLVT